MRQSGIRVDIHFGRWIPLHHWLDRADRSVYSCRMLLVRLINMPFGHLGMPSLALTRLKAALLARFGPQLDVEIVYLNMDVALSDGMRQVYDLALSDKGFMTGLGDWLFRQAAFPDVPDNSEAYLDRFYFDDSDESEAVRAFVKEQRPRLPDLLDALIERYRLAEADIVGFTSLFAQTVPSAAMARCLKAADPDVVTIMGGPLCEGEPGTELARQLDHVDYVFCGPALRSLPEFVGHVLEGDRDACRQVRGVVSVQDERSALVTPGETEDWDRIDPPGYADFLLAFDLHFPDSNIPPVLLFQTSRGCWWGEKSLCTFCGLNGPECRFDAMPTRQALVQFEALFRNPSRSHSYAAVDNIMPETYPGDVFGRISPPAGARIQYEVRPSLSKEQIRLLCGAGVSTLQPGIEALSTPTLRLMRKGLSAFDNICFLKNCAGQPVTLRWNLLLFTPGEDESTYARYLEDIPRLAHLYPPEGAFPVNFVRNSRYAAEPGKYGLDLRPQDFYELTYPFAPDALKRIATVFVDQNADPVRQDAWLRRLNRAIDRWRQRYFNSDGCVQSRLLIHEEASQPGVYDSRDGNETRYTIGTRTRDVLLFLDKPRRQSEIEREFGDVTPIVAELRHRQLLFEEGDRMMSLALQFPSDR